MYVSEENMNKNNLRGFTLIELLISFAIVAILLLGAAQLVLHSLYVKRASDCGLESAILASDKLEYLKSLPFESPELEENSIVERIDSQRRNDVFQLEWEVIDISSNMKKIEVECFAESCVHKTARFVLIYSKDLGF
jgi:prepilin-type N-terminal cleavage/methylation domain-containing protein